MRRATGFLCYDNYMRIIPDPPKRLSNLDKHGMDMDLLTEAFFETAAIAPAKSGRYAAVNLFEGKPVTVIFKPVGSEAIAPISMRPANKKERRML
jgi:uncharacterized DUF497 family protein